MKIKDIFNSDIYYEKYYSNYFGNKDVRLRLSDNRIQYKRDGKWVDAANYIEPEGKKVYLTDRYFYVAPSYKYYFYTFVQKLRAIKHLIYNT